MGKCRYNTKKFDLNNDDILWERFMCFVRLFIPWEEQLHRLIDIQQPPMMAFIYEVEIMGEGHIGFMELHRNHIAVSKVINALGILQVSELYIDNLKGLPKLYVSIDEMYGYCINEEEFDKRIEDMNNLYESFDRNFYEYGNKEIEDKIIDYVREHHFEFFSYID